MNNIFINNNDIDGLQFGSSSVSKVYFGSSLVYEDTPTPIPNYLQFTAVNGAATIGMSGSATPNISYSFDGTNWIVWDYSNLTIPSGSTVYMKGNNPYGVSSSFNKKEFTMTGTVEGGGNIMSLLYDDNFENNLTIPSTLCFYGLFSGCTGLTSAPELPATTLTEDCYRYMFQGCTSLTTAPTILPATTLVMRCYSSMFTNCTSLTTAPTLPATTLVANCYREMFSGCTNLNYIKMIATDISASYCLYNWVSGVAATGTFVKNSAATWTTTGNSGVPSRWTIEYASS